MLITQGAQLGALWWPRVWGVYSHYHPNSRKASWEHGLSGIFFFPTTALTSRGYPGGTSGKERNWQFKRHNIKDLGLIPGLERSPGEGNGNPLQHSCLGNPMDCGAWKTTVHGVAESWTWFSNWTTNKQSEISQVVTSKDPVLRYAVSS